MKKSKIVFKMYISSKNKYFTDKKGYFSFPKIK